LDAGTQNLGTVVGHKCVALLGPNGVAHS
jgi:hypothetical protein